MASVFGKIEDNNSNIWVTLWVTWKIVLVIKSTKHDFSSLKLPSAVKTNSLGRLIQYAKSIY